MATEAFISPALGLKAFNCPNCRVYAKQHWRHMAGAEKPTGYGLRYQNESFMISLCTSCGAPTIWHGDALVFPDVAGIEAPSSDLPEHIRNDYDEARRIVNRSPRGAAALLRLSIQKLCKHLGQPGKNINDDIGALVAAGLPVRVQQALDSVRVIGNEAVHPGTMDLGDDHGTAIKLFRLVNFIAHKMITEPREIDEIYGSLPSDKLVGIAKRDGVKS